MSSKEDIAKNDSKTVQVTVVIFYNGTHWGEKQEDHLQIIEIVFLVIIILVSFGTNIFLLVTISSSYTLRRVPFNVLLANLSMVFLIETLLNMSFALFYVTMDSWKLGTAGCSISAFLVQLVTLEVTFSLCVLCAEGMVSVWQPFRFQSYVTMKKQIVAIATMWIAGILLCVPLLLKSITCRIFPSRYSCGSTGQDGFVHALFLTIWCYCLMIVLGLACLLNLGYRQYREYSIQKRKQGVNFSDIFIQGDLWTEWVNFKLVAWLAFFYLILELPYIVVHQISALRNYDNFVRSNETLENQIIETPKFETVFTWFRYIYSILFALLVFKMRKDIRHKLRALIICCNTNAVRDHSALPVIRSETKKNKGNRKDSFPPLSLNTPVLYVSPDGLCLRQLDPVSNLRNLKTKFKKKIQPSFTSYLCDVDSSLTTEEFMAAESSFDSRSSQQRRLSKESEVSLPYLESGNSGNLGFDAKPLKDINTFILESPEQKVSPPVKKTVRFSDTLTIYRSSPKYETPSWIVNKNKKMISGLKKRISRIPTRIRKTDHAEPWKVEMSDTFSISTPYSNYRAQESDQKQVSTIQARGKPKYDFIARNKRRVKNKLASPPRWKIRKL